MFYSEWTLHTVNSGRLLLRSDFAIYDSTQQFQARTELLISLVQDGSRWRLIAESYCP